MSGHSVLSRSTFPHNSRIGTAHTDPTTQVLDIPTASKAALAQTAVATILNYAGYRAIPNGIEERCPSIIHLDADDYRALDIPDVLRSAPDLLVYSPSECTFDLLEVKFTRNWTADGLRMMLSKLQRQQALYPTAKTVILRSASPAEAPGADDLVRVLPPDELLLLATAQVVGDRKLRAIGNSSVADPALESIWQSLQPLEELFPRLTSIEGWAEVLLRLISAVPPLLSRNAGRV